MNRNVSPAYWVAVMVVTMLVMIGIVSTLFLVMPALDAMAWAAIVGSGMIAVSFYKAAAQ